MVDLKEEEIKLKGKKHYGGYIGFNDRGSFTYRLGLNIAGGSVFSVLPISSVKHRKKKPTKTAMYRSGKDLIIADDWGERYRLEASEGVIDALLAEGIKHKLGMAKPDDK